MYWIAIDCIQFGSDFGLIWCQGHNTLVSTLLICGQYVDAVALGHNNMELSSSQTETSRQSQSQCKWRLPSNNPTSTFLLSLVSKLWIKKSLYFIVWMSDFPLFLQLCHILSCLDVISWSKAKEESYFTPNSVCELHFSHFEVIPAIWKVAGCILKCNPDSHNLTTRLNCPSAILQWADWILCWDEKPNCYQITLTGTNSHRSTWLSGDLQLPHLQLEWAFAKSGSSLLFNQFLSLYLCR